MIKMKIHMIPKTRDSKNFFFFTSCYFTIVMTRILLTSLLSDLGNGISASFFHKHHVILFLTVLVCV